jgi:transcriptional regulator with XRE-family HTH domain
MKRLTILREDRGMTRMRLAALASIGAPRIGQMELGRLSPPPRSVELKRLARALRWAGDPAALLDDVDPR